MVILYIVFIRILSSQHDTQAQWDDQFGNATRILNAPVVADEWNLIDRGKSGCVPGTFQPSQVPVFLNYLHSLNIGLVAFHLSPGTLIQGDGNINDPWNYANPTKFDNGTPPTVTCPNTWTFPDADPTVQAAGQEILQYFLQYSTPDISPTRNPSNTPTPTTSPSPTSTPTPNPADTSFTVTIYPHGLGDCADNASPTGGNTNPLHTTRTVTLTIFDTQNTPISQPVPATVVYNPTSQTFQGTIDVGMLASGVYLATIKMDGFLGKQYPNIITVTQGKTITLPQIALVAGDTNNDNQLDIQDYNNLISCFMSKFTTPSCLFPTTSQSPGADLDDNGTVDGADYNLFLRELSVQKGV